MAGKFLDLRTNAGPLGADVEVLAERLRGAPYGLTSQAFRDIRDILMASVRTNMDSGLTPLSPVTKEYKARVGLDSRTLHASGNTAAGLDGKFGGTWAKAQRGQNEWYIFLHDRGRGYSYWSVDGKRKANKIGSRKQRRERTRPGTTPFPERRVFFINGAAESSVMSRYSRLVDDLIGEVGK